MTFHPLLEGPAPFASPWTDDRPTGAAGATGPTPPIGAASRAWAEALAEPGSWSQEAWRVVAPVLIELEAWNLAGLVVECGWARHAFWPHAPGRRQGLLTLHQQAQDGRWSFNLPTLNGSAFTRASGDAVDSFFQAVLSAGALRPGCPLALPGALRQAVAAALITHLKRWEHTPGHPAWIAPILNLLPTLPAPRSSAQPLNTPHLPLPVAVVSQERRDAAMTEQARHLAASGDFEGACRRLEQVSLPDQMPLEMIRLMSAIAVDPATGGQWHIQRMASLIEHLATHPHRLFEPTLGMSADGKLLDLCTWDLSHTSPHCRGSKGNDAGGLSAALAKVLFELHLRHGRISEGTKFVVGHKGSGKLAATISQCIKEQGWEPRSPHWSNTGKVVVGVLVAAPAHGSPAVGMLDHDITDGKPLSTLLRRWLSALDDNSADEKAKRRAGGIVRSARNLESLRQVLAVLDQRPDRPLEFYESIADSGAHIGAWELLDRVLQTINQRCEGRFGPHFWPTLYLRAGNFQDGWAAARTVFLRRGRHPGSPTAREWRALFTRVRGAPSMADAISLYRHHRSAMGAPAKIAALKTLLLRGAYMGQSAHCQLLLTELAPLVGWNDIEASMARLILHDTPGQVKDVSLKLNLLAGQKRSLDLCEARDLIDWHMRKGQRDNAAAFIRSSLDRDNTLYRSALGWQADGVRPPRIDFAIESIYQQDRGEFDRRWSSPSLSEVLALLHLHFLDGRLSPGVHLLLPRYMKTAQQGMVAAYLREQGMGLEAAGGETGQASRFLRVVSLGLPAPPAQPEHSANDSQAAGGGQRLSPAMHAELQVDAS